MDNTKPPLTDAEIRQEFETRKEKDIELGIRLMALEGLLVGKGILAPGQLDEASLQQAEKFREMMKLFVESTKKSKPGRVQ